MSSEDKNWTIGIRFGKCPDDIAEVIYDILVEDLAARGLDYEPCIPEGAGLQISEDEIKGQETAGPRP